jgi:hypothetical protein
MTLLRGAALPSRYTIGKGLSLQFQIPMSSNTAEARVPGFWPSLKEAVMGSRQDFTEGSIDRAIVLLAVPMVLEMIMESLFGVVDVFWVAHLGADAITTVGLTETCLTVVFVIALGLSMGATAMVARRIGEKMKRRPVWWRFRPLWLVWWSR